LSVFRLPETLCEALNGLPATFADKFAGDVTADWDTAEGDVLTEALGCPETGMLPTVEFTDCWALAEGEVEAVAEEVNGEPARFALDPNNPGPL
jgi:hypothetical protein